MKFKNYLDVISAKPAIIMFFLSIVVISLYWVIVFMKPLDLIRDSKDRTWIELVDNVEDGRGYKACPTSYIPNCTLTNQLTAIREPVPVLLFSVYIALTHEYMIFLQGAQLFFSLAILWGTYWLGSEIKDHLLGLIAAVAWALYLPVVRVEIHLNGDLAAGVFVTYGMLMFVRAIKYGLLRDWLLSGLVLGLAILSRSSVIVFAASLLAGYIFHVWIIEKRLTVGIVKNVVLAGLVMGLTVLPWVIRNQVVFGKPMMGTTLVGYNIYRHNAIIARDDFYPHYVGPDEAEVLLGELTVKHPELNTPINEVQVNQIFQNEAVKLILANPKEYAQLVIYRFIPLWFNLGILNQYGDPMTILDYLVVAQQVILLVAILFVMWKGEARLRFLGLSLFLFMATYMAVGSQLRYLIPIAPSIIVLSALSIPYFLPNLFSTRIPDIYRNPRM